MEGLVVTAEAREVEIHTSWQSLVGQDPRVQTKTAFTLNELVQLTSDFSMKRKDGTDRTAGCVASPIRTDRKQFLLVYRVRCNEKDKNGKLISDPAGHVVRLKFDLKRMQETHSAPDLDVRVSCSCPAFLYWGAQWNLGTGDALYGKPRPKYQPPTEARRYQYVICKHIKVVYDRCKPLVEKMVGAYRGVQDAKKEEESKKQIEQVKQQQEQEVQELEPITPKKPLPEEGELEAMPEDLSELGLQPKPPTPKEEAPKRPPITPKVQPEAEEPEVTPPGRKAPKKKPAPAPAPPPEEEDEEAPGPKARRMVAPNITVHDEDEGETTILPGAKARRMEEAPTRFSPEDIEVVPRTHKPTLWEDEEEDQPGPKAKRMQRQKEPARVIPMDEDDDEPIILPGRGRRSSVKHLMASLVLAQAEV